MSTAVIYVRQSRHKDTERTVSPEVQEAACRALPAVQRCGDLVEVFTDLDVSGGKKSRLGYDAMLARIRAGGVDVVAAYDQSRAFRSLSLALSFHELLEERAHRSVEVHFVHGSFDRSTVGGFSYQVLAAAHEMERKMTGDKLREAYRHMNARGAATGMPPYGYRRAEAGLVVDEDQAAVVRRLYADYAAGQASTRALAAHLNAEGIVKPGSRSQGLGWVPDTIVDLLQNRAYVGETYSVSRARREGQLIPATWPAIIERGVFERVQRVLAKNRISGRGGVRRGVKHSYAFAGLLECAACGRPLRAHTINGSSYYSCRRDVGERQCPGAHRGVREARLLPWAGLLFDRVDALRPEDFDKALSEATRRGRSSPDAIAQVERSLERQKKLFSWGHVDEADYLREAARLSELREQLTASLPVRRTVRPQGLREVWQRDDPEARRQLLGTLFDRLILKDGEIVEYVPRREYAAEVIALVDQAVGPAGFITAPQSEYGWRARGRPRKKFANGGKGGIPTVDWQYRVRIA